MRQHEQAIAAAQQALVVAPNYAEGYARLGEALAFAGRPAETREWLEKAMRLNPHEQSFYYGVLGHAAILLERYEEAVAALQRAVVGNPDVLPAHVFLAIAYAELGQTEAARTEIKHVVRLGPVMSRDEARERFPYKDPLVTERVLDSMWKAAATLRVRDRIALVMIRLVRYFRSLAWKTYPHSIC